jgi:hypothetical protein
MNMEPAANPAITGIGSGPFTPKETDGFGFCCAGLAPLGCENCFEFYASLRGAELRAPRTAMLELVP